MAQSLVSRAYAQSYAAFLAAAAKGRQFSYWPCATCFEGAER